MCKAEVRNTKQQQKNLNVLIDWSYTERFS